MALMNTIIPLQADASGVLNKNFAHGKWWGEDVTVSKQAFGNQRLSAGAEFRENFQQDQGNYDVKPFRSIL